MSVFKGEDDRFARACKHHSAGRLTYVTAPSDQVQPVHPNQDAPDRDSCDASDISMVKRAHRGCWRKGVWPNSFQCQSVTPLNH